MLQKDKLIPSLKDADVHVAGVGRGATKDRRPLTVAEQRKVTDFWSAYFKLSGAESIDIGQNIPSRVQRTRGSCSAPNGRAASKARLARRTSVSAPIAPTICRPIGSPSRVNPHGMDAAGCCVKLNGYVKGHHCVHASPHSAEGGTTWPTSKAARGMLGVSSRS